MTCQELADFMLEYVEGTLPADTRQRFDAHLAVCEDCVTYLTDYRATIAGVRSAARAADDVAALPEALVRAIMDSRRA